MTRIIGVGSPFGADRLAWEAVDHLSALSLEGCELIKLDRPGSALLSWFEGAGHLILLDALATDGDPGAASLLDESRLDRLSPTTSTHGFGVVQAIDLARRLGQLPARLQIVGLHTGADLGLLPALDGEGLEGLIRSLL